MLRPREGWRGSAEQLGWFGSGKSFAQCLLNGRSPFGCLEIGDDGLHEFGLKDRDLDDDALIALMVANPILIERPIVVSRGKAALGRPPESVLEIL